MQPERVHQHVLAHHDHVSPSHRPLQRRALAFCFTLTLLMMMAEFVTGMWYGSLMLISDGVHMLSHAGALALSWIALAIAGRTSGKGLSYGLYRVEILAALANATGLVAFSAWIIFQAVSRVLNPIAVSGAEVTGVAIAGLGINIVTILILHGAGAWDLNTRSALLHMIADLVSSLVIVVGGSIIWMTGWVVLDPLLSLAVAVVIAKWSFTLLRDSFMVLLESQPQHLSQEQIEGSLLQSFPQIKGLHDLHLWEITSHFICLSVHVVVEDTLLSDVQDLRRSISAFLLDRYGIGHCVIQLEC